MVLVFTLWDILGYAQVGGVIVVLVLETKVSSGDVQMFRFELSMLS